MEEEWGRAVREVVVVIVAMVSEEQYAAEMISRYAACCKQKDEKQTARWLLS